MTLLKKSALLILGLSVSVFAGDVCEGMFNAGDYKRAGECYIGELKKNKTIVNYYYAGSSLERQGRYKEALSYMKEAEKRATGQGDLGLIYNQLSLIYSSLGDKKAELAYDMKYLDIKLKIGEEKGIGIAYSNLGAYYFSNDDDNKALEFFNKSLEYKEEKERAVTYQNMANVYNNLKDIAKAEEYYQKAIDIEISEGDYLSLCATKKNFGMLYKNQNRFDEAFPLLTDAKDICHKAGDIAREAHALAETAYLQYKRGDMVTAKSYINQAIPLAKQSGSVTILDDVAYNYKVITGQIKE